MSFLNLVTTIAQAIGIPQNGWYLASWDRFGQLSHRIVIPAYQWADGKGVLAIDGASIHFLITSPTQSVATVSIEIEIDAEGNEGDMVLGYGCDPVLLGNHGHLLGPIWEADRALHGLILNGVDPDDEPRSVQAFLRSHSAWLRTEGQLPPKTPPVAPDWAVE